MKPIIYAVIGVVCYGLTSVILEQKLSKFSTVWPEVLFVAPMLLVGAIWLFVQKQTGQRILMPHGSAFWIVMALGLVYFAADYFFLGAFTSGGNAVTITSIIVLSPVVTALVEYFWRGGKPNGYQIAGYLFAVASVMLMAKANSVR